MILKVTRRDLKAFELQTSIWQYESIDGYMYFKIQSSTRDKPQFLPLLRTCHDIGCSKATLEGSAAWFKRATSRIAHF